MRMTTTTWHPDTCGCVVEYEWDRDVTAEERVHTFKHLHKKCDDHSGLNGDHEHYDNVLKENQTKNLVLDHAMQHVPRLKFKGKDPSNGRDFERLHPDIEYVWKFVGKDHQRELVATFEGGNLSDAEIAGIHGRVSALGLGKKVTIK